MNISLKRPLQVLSTLTVACILAACGGATSTVDPFVPTRVIGLGDGYNGLVTVTGTGEVETVVGQVAALFGVSSANVVNNAATSPILISQLSSQTSGLTFSETDLVVLSIGTGDIKAAYDANPSNSDAAVAAAESAAASLATEIENMLQRGAKHVLVMQPLEFSTTPYGRANSATYPLNTSSSPTVSFISKLSGLLGEYIAHEGYSRNPVIYGGLGLSSDFNNYTATATAGNFSTSSQTPYCSNSSTSLTATCAVSTTDYDTTLFANGLYLTPAGNRWVAGYLYNATSYGWR